MNKSDVVERVSDMADVSRQQAEGVLAAFFDTVSSAVKSGDRVGWPSFGAFSMTQRKARTGRNPRTGEAVRIKASKAMKFSPSSALKEAMNSGRAGSSKKAAPAKKAGAKKATAKKGAAKKAAPAKSAGKASARKAPAKKTAKKSR